METILIVLAIFFILLFLNVPIGTSMGVASIIGFILIDFNLATVGSIVYTSVSSVSLMCIPGYILAGSMMSQGGIADALVRSMRMDWTSARRPCGRHCCGVRVLCRHYGLERCNTGSSRRPDDPGHAGCGLR